MNPPTNLGELQAACRAGASFPFVFFWGHRPAQDGKVMRTCLSQWYAAPIWIGTEGFPTAEHYMMAEKARLFGDEQVAKEIIRSPSPTEAKGWGRKVRGFDEQKWLLHREQIVLRGNLAKFSQHNHLRTYLIGTGNAVLVEASPQDPIWGIGMAEEDPRAANPQLWEGLNLLGFVLMQVRSALGQNLAG
jgi:ribA/ribD-fused uncharacterized protein